jgi:hypothetical protein
MLSAHCGGASVASDLFGSLIKTGQDSQIIFRWRFQPLFQLRDNMFDVCVQGTKPVRLSRVCSGTIYATSGLLQ